MYKKIDIEKIVFENSAEIYAGWEKIEIDNR